MCNIDRASEAQILAMGLNLFTKAIEASVKENNPIQSTDVLASATTAYQQGKITKSQFITVINALDEATYQTKAYAEPCGHSEWIEANHYLNQYRK